MSINEAQLFDIQNYKAYKRDIWNPKYKEGLYFSALEELGEEILIYFGVKKKDEYALHWHTTPHALHDGFSALNALAKEQDFTVKFPEYQYRPMKHPLKAVRTALKSTPKENHRLLNQDSNLKGTDFTYLELKLPVIESKLSNTALMASIVCPILMQHFTSNKSSRWMVPVRLKNDPGLQASYVGLEVDTDDNAKTLHQKLVSKLKNEEHWGFQLLSRIGLFLGKKAILYLTKKNVLSQKTIWLGSISNMGPMTSSPELEELVILHPVRWHRPLGVVIYQLNGQQIITIAFHHSLKEVDSDGIKQDITRTYNSLL